MSYVSLQKDLGSLHLKKCNELEKSKTDKASGGSKRELPSYWNSSITPHPMNKTVVKFANEAVKHEKKWK